MKTRKLLSAVICITIMLMTYSYVNVSSAGIDFKPKPKIVDLLSTHMKLNSTYPFVQDGGNYSYSAARDGEWYGSPTSCWLSGSEWNGAKNYLQVELDNEYKLTEIKFTLRQGADSSWFHQGTQIQASNSPGFDQYDSIWYDGNTDKGFDIITVNISGSQYSDNSYKYIRFENQNPGYPIGLTELKIYGYELTIDLLTSHLNANSAYPRIESGANYTYSAARDGDWFGPATTCWLTGTDWNGTKNYLQLELDDSYKLTEIKFSLRQGADNSWCHQGTQIRASNSPNFDQFDSIWYDGNTDLGFGIITANISDTDYGDNYYKYIRFINENPGYPVGLTELQIFGFEDDRNTKGVFELLDEFENITPTAYPAQYSDQYGYNNVRNDWWGIGANDMWFSQEAEGCYLQVELQEVSYITSIKFVLRPDPGWDAGQWRKNVGIEASNDPSFATYETLWSSGEIDPGLSPTEVEVDKKFKYIRFKRTIGSLGVGISELRVYGFRDIVMYSIDGVKSAQIQNGNELTVEVQWPNIGQNEGSLKCINAKYSADGNLVAVDVLPATYIVTDQRISVGTSNLGSITEGMYVKTFFWSDSMQPLRDYSYIK